MGQGSKALTYDSIRKIKENVNDIKEDNIIYKEVSGRYFTINDNTFNKVKNINIFGESTQNVLRNLLNYESWQKVTSSDNPGGSVVNENKGVTITCGAIPPLYTNYLADKFPEDVRIPVSEGVRIAMFWDLEEMTTNSGDVYIYINGGAIENGYYWNYSSAGKLIVTIPAGATFITFTFRGILANNTVKFKNIVIRLAQTSEEDNYQTSTTE